MTINRILNNNIFTVDDPQDGCFWRALTVNELDQFFNDREHFGDTTIETTGTSVGGKKCIRCRPDREGVTPWLTSDGEILKIPIDKLQPGVDWIIAGKAGDIHLLVSSALEHGQIWGKSGDNNDENNNGTE